MRKTNKQFTEEVFRRSEERIQKQKQKKRAYITVGKSLAACLVFFVALGAIPYIWDDGGSNGEVESVGTEITSDIETEQMTSGKELIVQAADLMAGFTKKEETATEETMESDSVENENDVILETDFLTSQMNLSVKLFQQSVAKTSDQNTLISPLSVNLALAMTANGAKGQTLAEMEQLLADGKSIEELNRWFYSYVNDLPSHENYKLSIANSIWFRDDERLVVEKDFLQTNANYYNAAVYKSPFDHTTVTDVNNWVDYHTDGMIKEMLNEIDEATMLYLINAVCFDAKWQSAYSKGEVKEGIFTAQNGEERKVEMMHSVESLYLENENVIGFAKNYRDRKYSFVALLPKNSIELKDYIQQLTGEELQELLMNKQKESVNAIIPKFSYEYELSMEDVLKNLGMTDSFDPELADFSKMAASSEGNIFVSNVIHKTFITVTETGTRAGAATIVEEEEDMAILIGYQVELDRPFLYMIIDNETNLPIFIGTVLDVEGNR